jgi:uncharacterized protein YciI
MKFYVAKLMPPRPSFVGDMTSEERALMQAHSLYWRELMSKGQVVVFGPVLDPTGPYGLCVLRLEDAIDPKTVCDADPVIKEGSGFKFQVAPMLSAVLPE